MQMIFDCIYIDRAIRHGHTSTQKKVLNKYRQNITTYTSIMIEMLTILKEMVK